MFYHSVSSSVSSPSSILLISSSSGVSSSCSPVSSGVISGVHVGGGVLDSVLNSSSAILLACCSGVGGLLLSVSSSSSLIACASASSSSLGVGLPVIWYIHLRTFASRGIGVVVVFAYVASMSSIECSSVMQSLYRALASSTFPSIASSTAVLQSSIAFASLAFMRSTSVCVSSGM